jgi:hypothetical protein
VIRLSRPDTLDRLFGDAPRSRALASLAPAVIADTVFISRLREALHDLWALAAYPSRADLGRAAELCEEISALMAALGSMRANRLARRWAQEWATATGLRPFGFPGSSSA